MGLLDKLRGEFVDIIEWVDDSRHTLVWRFPRYHNQIKHGAQLTVRPGQVAVFVDQGKIADVFQPGMVQLSTANLPVLSTLRGWKHGFDSPFKSEVYFVSTRQVTDLKWGTPNPVMLRDPDFGVVRLRAFGVYALKAVDPTALLKELVGTDGVFETEELGELMRSIISTAFSDLLGESKVAALDLAGSYRELSEALRKIVSERIDNEYGLEVPQLSIVNISLPEAVERALDTRSSMGIIGDMRAYQQYQMGTAIPVAAANPGGGGAAAGMGLGMGMAMAHQVAQGMLAGAAPLAGSPSVAGPPPLAPPPPLPVAPVVHVSLNGQAQGPYQLAQVIAAIQQGQVTGQTMVWMPGMASWAPLAQVPQLSSYLLVPPSPAPPKLQAE